MDKNNKHHVVAGIDLGSHSIKMKIAEIDENGKVRVLENLRRAAAVGTDTFSTGKVRFETVEKICDILKGYKQLMNDYDIDEYRIVATTAIREAKNREYIMDQIKIKTGFKIDIINNSEVKYITYKSIRDKVQNYKRFREEGTIIVDVGSGSTEISVYLKGNLAFTQSVKIGSLRIKEMLSSLERRTLDFPKILEEYVESQILGLRVFKTSMDINNFIAIGGEISIITQICNNTKNSSTFEIISEESFMDLYNELMYKPTNSMVREYNLPQDRADLLLPSMIIFKKFLDKTTSTSIQAPLVSLRDGLISDIVDNLFSTNRYREFIDDIVSSSRYTAEIYHSDLLHIDDVKKKSLIIFDQLKQLHGMGDEERLLLQIAANLHDIGKFTSLANHHQDSYNMIMSSDIMGISNEQLKIIANIAKYHGDEVPDYSQGNFKNLGKKNRLLVSKLVAILRIADALDSSHRQKVKKIEVLLKKESVVFYAEVVGDALLEVWTFETNSEFFQEVFGVTPILKTKRVVNGE